MKKYLFLTLLIQSFCTSYAQEPCNLVVTIDNLPTMVCPNDVIVLEATPPGGVFSGEAIVDGKVLDASLITTSAYHPVIYTYTDSLTGCMYEAFDDFTTDILLATGFTFLPVYNEHHVQGTEDLYFKLDRATGSYEPIPETVVGTVTIDGEIVDNFDTFHYKYTPPVGTSCDVPIHFKAIVKIDGFSEGCYEKTFESTMTLYCCPTPEEIIAQAFSDVQSVYCIGEEPKELGTYYYLPGGINPGECIYEGRGINGFVFNPTIAGIGQHEISYDHIITLEDHFNLEVVGGCYERVYQTVEVIGINLEIADTSLQVADNETIAFELTASSSVENSSLTYDWTTDIPNGLQYLSRTTCPNPIFTGGVEGTYQVLITDDNGCQTEGAIHVEKTSVGIPNSFLAHEVHIPTIVRLSEPFNIIGKDIKKIKVHIYNTNGQLIHTANNQQVNWNTSNLPTGLYFYQVALTFTDNTVGQKNGQLMLLK